MRHRGILNEALVKGTSAAPRRVYAVLVAFFGLLTVTLGWLWATEEPRLPRTVFESAEAAGGSEFAEPFLVMAAVTAALLLSWSVVGRRAGIRRPPGRGPSGPSS